MEAALTFGVLLKDQIAAVIPCLNEAATIGALVSAVRDYAEIVIVVDDGSSDATAATAHGAGAVVIRHDRPGGKGLALMNGWRRAREMGFPRAITLDGDGQHDPADIPAFVAAAERAALVVGNRMSRPEAMPRVRRVVNRWMSRRLSRLTGHELPDTQCGFRLVDLEALKDLLITTTHFEIESEVLLAFLAAGYGVEFVPVRVIYRTERSKISPVRDTIRWFRWLKRAARDRRTGGDRKRALSPHP